MSQQDLDKWNQRYAENTYRKGNPVTLISDWVPRFAKGRALDIACGGGRNSIYLAQQGFQVDAIDISPEGLKIAQQQARENGLDINWMVHDLDDPYVFESHYNLIIVMWYVNLPLIRKLTRQLAPGGCLISQQHLISTDEVIGPRSTGFRVAPGQLREAVEGLDILLDEESVEDTPEGGKLSSARIVAQNNKTG